MHQLPAIPTTALFVAEPAHSPLACDGIAAVQAMLFQLLGSDCHSCDDARKAIAMAENLGPSVIFQGMHMQGSHGLDMLRSYRQHDFLGATPVILLTFHDTKLLRELAFQRGASGFIDETPSFGELSASVHHWSSYYALQMDQISNQQHLEVMQKDLEVCKEKLQQALSLDVLTGLLSRQSFTSIYEREWSRALRETESLSLMLVDVDCFKLYNDCYGHAKGDVCLQMIAEVLARIVKRPTDFCGRYSGAAFMMLLPATPAKGAVQLGEKIRKAVLALEIPHQGSDIEPYITVSVGLGTTSPMFKHAPRDLIRVVDHALFDAKMQGRNCLVCKSL